MVALARENAPTMPADAWRTALPALFAVLLAIVVLFRATAASMVSIWIESETFTHAFLVPPISLWLIWRIRKELALFPPRPCLWVLPVLLATGFVWLLAELATVGVVAQFALMTMIVLAVPAVLGLPVARRMAFPLAFLYFAVPFGEFVLPQFMEWTASFTVLGLRLSGIPVYREGLHFVIPSGNWSVVEACSGVRYLIASLTVGTLFAYLNYRSLKRRLIFVGVSLVVPVVANWLRAYMIVMLGHLSGNKLAAGVDHLIYGWLFFGLVLMAMFWIGARWREDDLPDSGVPPEQPSAYAVARISPVVMAVATMLVLAVWPLAQWKIDHSERADVERLSPLAAIPGWQESPQALADWTPSFSLPSAVLQQTFSANGNPVGVYIGYYRNQDYRRKLVSSSNVLVRSNDRQWARVTSGVREVEVAGRAVAARTAELRSAGTRLTVWQWYWINGHWTASDPLAKGLTAWSRVTGQGDDSAVIIVYAEKELAADQALLESFVRQAGPAIEQALLRTQEQR